MELAQVHLSSLPFWEGLTEPQRQALLGGMTEQALPKGSLLGSAEGEEYGLLWVLEGSVRVYLVSEEGREVTLFHLRVGDVCTLMSAHLADQLPIAPQMIVEEDCRILAIGMHTVRRLMEEEAEVRCFVHEQGSRHLVQMIWAMEQILFLHVDRRLASFLLEEYRRTGNRQIRLTHEQIAQQISSAREVVARMVKRFSAQGLVEAKRGSICLTDLEGLQKLNG